MPNRKTSFSGIKPVAEKMTEAGVPYGTLVQFTRDGHPGAGRAVGIFGPPGDQMLIIHDEVLDVKLIRSMHEIQIIGGQT